MSDVLLKEMDEKVYQSEKDKLVRKAEKEKIERQLATTAKGTNEANQFAEELGSVMGMLKEN